jgi:hypothetical protein
MLPPDFNNTMCPLLLLAARSRSILNHQDVRIFHWLECLAVPGEGNSQDGHYQAAARSTHRHRFQRRCYGQFRRICQVRQEGEEVRLGLIIPFGYTGSNDAEARV